MIATATNDKMQTMLKNTPLFGSTIKELKGTEGKNAAYRVVREKFYDYLISEYIKNDLKQKHSVFVEVGTHDANIFRYLYSRLEKTYDHYYLFDTFDGIPEAWLPHVPQGHFAIRDEKKRPSFEEYDDDENQNNITLTVASSGYKDALLSKLSGDAKIGFLHIDTIVYSSTKETLLALDSRIHSGCIIVFDELYHYEGAYPQLKNDHEMRALCEWIDEKKRDVKFLSRNGYMQAALQVIK